MLVMLATILMSGASIAHSVCLSVGLSVGLSVCLQPKFDNSVFLPSFLENFEATRSSFKMTNQQIL